LTFKHPKPYKTAKEKLAYLNKKLALKKRGSNNRKKAKRSLARAYERVSNIRDDFQHKMANLLVKSYDVIAMEDLNIKSMMESESKEVNKSNISDASMSSFMFKVAYKAERAGKQLIKVNPRNTSKTCSSCGKLKDNLTLHDRTYNCEHCKLKMDRDKNAAVNILRLGISLVGSYGRSPAL
jgi:putative transposase